MEPTIQIPQSAARQQVNISSFKKAIFSDFVQMVAAFVGAIVAVYFAPSVVNYLYFLVILGLAWRTKKDYFYFAFFFVLINSPAHLFVETSATAIKRLPLYTVVSGISFSVFDLFVLVTIAKILYFKLGKGKKFVLTKSAKFLLFYLLLVSLPMTFIIGFKESDPGFLNNIRPYAYYAIVYSFYMLIGKTEDLFKMGYLFAPFLVFTLFDQLFLLTTGRLFISVINPETVRYIVENTITGGARAYFSGFLLLFYAFLFGLQLRMNRKYEVVSGIGYLIIIFALSIFILSATRAYLMMPVMTIFGFMLYSKKAAPDLIKLSLAAALFGVVFFSLNIISWESFMKGIWPRFQAFFDVIFAETNTGLQNFDTVGSRLETDLPELLEGISLSPILGAGFSGHFRRYINDDLGFLNGILVFGIVGFLLLLNFLIFFLKDVNKWIKSKFAGDDEKVILKSIAMIFFGILLGFATTYDYFTVMHTYRIYFISLLLGSAEVAAYNIRERRNHFFKHKYSKS